MAPTSSLNSLNRAPKNRLEVSVGRHGVVATDDGRCSKIGMDVLREGGHAVDASVAAYDGNATLKKSGTPLWQFPVNLQAFKKLGCNTESYHGKGLSGQLWILLVGDSRMNLGDPDFVDLSKVLSDMLSPKFTATLKKAINDNRTFDASHYGDRLAALIVTLLEKLKQYMFFVCGSFCNIACTFACQAGQEQQKQTQKETKQTNNTEPRTQKQRRISKPEYSGQTSQKYSPCNTIAKYRNIPYIRTGKSPLSSMSPTIVLKDGKLKAVLGASGGANIIAGTTEVFLNHFALKMDPLSSVMTPRVYHQNWTAVSGDHFEVPADIRASLKKGGHVLESIPGATSVCQLIVQESETNKGNGGVGRLVGVLVTQEKEGFLLVFDNL
ncbi:hypothetical protein Dsin_000209 [Dipteronia sinensis]|uniref:Gamma-glutamyltransferase n=1 Tax=Dipteronia sinensis TaxID=43782 RepID=A0AAE0DHA5_9ROSI|nr:hypothetical protein Dsin_000209 [Dipteronia sinensis]